MKKRKCMADGGVIEQASRKVRQAAGGIADFLHIGKPAETTVLPPGQRGIPNDRPIVQADTRPDMPQERNPRRFAEEVDQRKQARSGGYARGGIIPVQGIGSGTSDSIPVVLAGHEVKVSNGEGVAVLPAKTMRTPGALDAVEGIIAATNKKPPQPRTGGATGYQTGVAGLVDDTANRIVQAPAMQPSAAQGILAGVREFAAPLAPSMGPNLAASAAPPGTGQSQGFIGGADYRGGPDKNVGFVWPDGTPRVQPGQQGAVAPVAKAPGLMTMKEKDIAAGLDPNRAYRAGSAGDPYSATGGIAAAAQGRGPVPVADAGGSQAQMLDAVPGRRRGRRVPGYQQGGIMAELPVRQVPDAIDIARGVMETERARAADAASRAAYAKVLASDDALTRAQASGRTLPVVVQKPPTPPTTSVVPFAHQTNWTLGSNAPALEGTVETRFDQARQAFSSSPKAIEAPRPATAVVPGATVPNWTYGEPTAYGQPSRFDIPRSPALPPPPPMFTPDLDGRGMQNTAAGARAKKAASPQAAAYTASRPEPSAAPEPRAAPKQTFMSGANETLRAGMRGELPPGVGRKYTPVMDTVAGRTGSAIGNGVQKAARVLAPVAVGADAINRASTVAGVAQDPNSSGYDVATAGAEQASQMAGGLAGAGIGAKTAMMLGAPAIAASGPFAPVTAAGLGILGGGLGYYGGEKLVQGLTSAGRRLVGQDATEQPSAVAPSTAPVARRPAQQPIAATYSNEGRPSAIQDANVAPASDRTGIDTLPSGIVSANMGRGFDPTKLQMADGYGAATNAAGKTLFVSPGQYRAADGSATADWRQTQEYKDAIDRNAADKLRLAEMQAQRQGRDPVATLAASRGIADAVLNAPIERQTKQAQAQTAQQQAAAGKFAVQQAQELNDLYAAHQAATTPAEQERIAEMIRVRTGKDKPDEYAHASGGTTVNPTTMAVEKTPDVIYNRRTGQPPNAGRGGAAQSSPYPDGTELKNRKDGKTYVVVNGQPVLKGQ